MFSGNKIVNRKSQSWVCLAHVSFPTVLMCACCISPLYVQSTNTSENVSYFSERKKQIYLSL